jgi:hypothetical protein
VPAAEFGKFPRVAVQVVERELWVLYDFRLNSAGGLYRLDLLQRCLRAVQQDTCHQSDKRHRKNEK